MFSALTKSLLKSSITKLDLGRESNGFFFFFSAASNGFVGYYFSSSYYFFFSFLGCYFLGCSFFGCYFFGSSFFFWANSKSGVNCFWHNQVLPKKALLTSCSINFTNHLVNEGRVDRTDSSRTRVNKYLN